MALQANKVTKINVKFLKNSAEILTPSLCIKTPDCETPDKKKKPGLLLQAQKLLEPILATSTGSIYHVIALSSDLKLAARYKKGVVSVRAEGDILVHKNKLVEAGFNLYPNYASFHVSATGVLCHKVVGAAIMGLEHPFEEILCNMSKLIGIGT